MITYNYYIEAVNKRDNFISAYIEGYPTLEKLNNAKQKWLKDNIHLTITGYCLYTFNGKKNYRYENYEVLERVNVKCFFELFIDDSMLTGSVETAQLMLSTFKKCF